MKSVFHIVLIFFLASCIQEGNSSGHAETSGNVDNGGAKIVFESLEHDFGRVIEGEKVGWYFKYRNEGKGNLIIKRVSASCGCTAPDYDKKPLGPGEDATIKVVYDSNGRSGMEIKTVTVETNGDPSVVKLKLMVEVINNNE